MTMPNPVKERGPGYAGGQATSAPMYAFREGHPEVVKLYKEFTGPGAQVKNWQFRSRVIKLAVKLISGRSNWFIGIDSDTSVQEYNYEFILDTVRFIATGKRKISIHSWPMLISHHPEDGTPEEHADIRKLFHTLALTTNHTDLIQRWCTQPNGIDDLMFSLNILFGNGSYRESTSLEDYTVSQEAVGADIKALGKKAFEFIASLLRSLLAKADEQFDQAKKLEGFFDKAAKENTANKSLPEVVKATYDVKVGSVFPASDLSAAQVNNFNTEVGKLIVVVKQYRDWGNAAGNAVKSFISKSDMTEAELDAALAVNHPFLKLGPVGESIDMALLGKVKYEGAKALDYRIKFEKPETEDKEVGLSFSDYEQLTGALVKLSSNVSALKEYRRSVAGTAMRTFGHDFTNKMATIPEDRAKVAIDTYSAVVKQLNGLDSIVDAVNKVSMQLGRVVQQVRKQIETVNAP